MTDFYMVHMLEDFLRLHPDVKADLERIGIDTSTAPPTYILGGLEALLERREKEKAPIKVEFAPLQDFATETSRREQVGTTMADIVQLPDLKRYIHDLSQLAEFYRAEKWQRIIGNTPRQVDTFRDRYLRMHKVIVDYFSRLTWGNFSIDDLTTFDSTQQKLVYQRDLEEKKTMVRRMQDLTARAEAYADGIRSMPIFEGYSAVEYGLETVQKCGITSEEVPEALVVGLLNHAVGDDVPTVHGNWLLARLFIHYQAKRIISAQEESARLESSFTVATPEEIRKLEVFKRNEDSLYSTPSYQVAYHNLCFDSFKKLGSKDQK